MNIVYITFNAVTNFSLLYFYILILKHTNLCVSDQTLKNKIMTCVFNDAVRVKLSKLNEKIGLKKHITVCRHYRNN